MLESAIWCHTTRCFEQSSSASLVVEEGMTLSSRGISVHFPLRVEFSIAVVSTCAIESNDASTLSMFTAPSQLSAVSFLRVLIWSCVSDIFLYTDSHIIGKND